MDKHSTNWGVDHLRKRVIYNLVDLSFIISSAIDCNIAYLYIPDIFPLYKHKKYGYDLKQYAGLILGVLAQLKGTNLKVIWHSSNMDEIEKMA